MIRYLLRRAAIALVLLFLLLSVLFVLIQLVPGDPTLFLVAPDTPREVQERLRELYGFDRPLVEQYLRWLRAVTLEGDWGISIIHGRPVTRVLGDALPNTLRLAGAAMVVEYSLALLLGIAAVRHRDRLADHAIRIGSLVAYSMPVFWLGLMVILVFAVYFPIFPPASMASVNADRLSALGRFADALWHLVLPALVLGGTAAGGTARLLRNSLLEVMSQDYIRTARAKGASEGRVLTVHALRNAAPPLAQLFGVSFPMLLNGSLVIEVVFSWPGLGRTTLQAIQTQDYPVLLAATALSGALVVFGSLTADLLHAWLDPRVRHGVVTA